MHGGPKPPRSSLAPLFHDQRDPDRHHRNQKKRWHNKRILEISLDDLRLSWPERELVKKLGNRLFGRFDWRRRKEVRRG